MLLIRKIVSKTSSLRARRPRVHLIELRIEVSCIFKKSQFVLNLRAHGLLNPSHTLSNVRATFQLRARNQTICVMWKSHIQSQ